MRKVISQDREFWVGTLKRRDSTEVGLVVYDPLRNTEKDSEYVVLFEVTELREGSFRKQVVKELIGSVEGYSDKEVDAAIAMYWRLEGPRRGEELRAIEEERLAIEKAHCHFLADRGLPPARTRLPSGREHRVTHCYSCKNHLDNAVDVECEACGWIICRCGACGCGYDGS